MESETSYTVFIRVPFPRGDFVDPPPVNWDASKDEALWKILSGVAKTEIDWNELAARFEVTVEFLLQQVTYLTERHASQVRAQMRKVTAAARSSAAPSPIPGSGSESGAAIEAMRRTGSAQGLRVHTRAPSSLSVRKDSPMLRIDGSIPGTPRFSTPASDAVGVGAAAGGRPQISRASSSGTAVQVGGTGSAAGSLGLKPGVVPPSPRIQTRHRLSSLPVVDSPTATATPTDQAAPTTPAVPSSPSPADSPSPTSSASSSPAQSRIIRRPPRFGHHQQRDQENTRASYLGDADDEEAEPAFLPFKSKSPSGDGADDSGSGDGSAHFTDPSATLRGDPRDFGANAARRLQNVTGPDPTGQGKGKGKEKEKEPQVLHRSQTSDSSASSAAFVSKRSLGDRRQPSGPLSPRRTAELKGKGYSREGSDGAPSMGSSYSDLDDTSITQSALEEALASKMQGGNTIGSTISNVFRSRYLPK